MDKDTQEFFINVIAIILVIIAIIGAFAFIVEGIGWWTVRFIIIWVPVAYSTYEWNKKLQND